MIYLLYAALLSFFASLFLTFAIKKYALRKGIIDIPNSRSSHSIPTPRGGGLSFIIVFLASLGILIALNKIDASTFLALFLAGGLIATIGFIDDRVDLNPRIRIITHFLAAIIGVYLLGGIPPLIFFGTEFDLGLCGNILAIVGTVWILNLSNFMDGIDGIASVEFISILIIISFFVYYYLSGESQGQELVILPILLASSIAGFLYWNFPPAKIFMGDAGSGFLGIMMALIGIKTSQIHSNFFWITLIMFGVFMVDATLTLFRRLLRGDKVYEAHRSHAYQFASRRFGHKKVTLSVLAINLIVLFPISLMVIFKCISGLSAFILSYIFLGVLAVLFNCGKPDQ